MVSVPANSYWLSHSVDMLYMIGGDDDVDPITEDEARGLPAGVRVGHVAPDGMGIEGGCAGR